MNRLNIKKNEFKHYNKSNSNLSHNSIWCIYEDNSATLWIGTLGGGLYKFNKTEEQFVSYKSDDSDGALSDDMIQCINQDTSGTLWIGTWSGLNRLDRTTGKFTVYRERDDLPNDIIYGILEDSQGFLWLSTNNGLSKFNPKKGVALRNYGVYDGLQSKEFTGGVFLKNKGGKLFFGGVNGFNAFFPDKLVDDDHEPSVVITDFLIENKPVEIERKGEKSPLMKPVQETESVTLSYKQNFFTFEFAALHYAAPSKNRYRYILEGYSDKWIETDAKNRRATYTNIEEGEYNFRVIGSNKDGV